MSDTNYPREGSPSPRWSALSEAEKRVKWDAKYLIERYSGSFEQYCNEQDALERQGDEARRADAAQTPAAPTSDPTRYSDLHVEWLDEKLRDSSTAPFDEWKRNR